MWTVWEGWWQFTKMKIKIKLEMEIWVWFVLLLRALIFGASACLVFRWSRSCWIKRLMTLSRCFINFTLFVIIVYFICNHHRRLYIAHFRPEHTRIESVNVIMRPRLHASYIANLQSNNHHDSLYILHKFIHINFMSTTQADNTLLDQRKRVV